MFEKDYILDKLILADQIDQIIDTIKRYAKVSNFNELSKFLKSMQSQELQTFNSKVTSDKCYIDIGENVLKSIEKKFQIKVVKFPVHGLRIVCGKPENLSPWHQDEGTWSHHDYLSNKNPITCWIPIKANKKNTLQICLDNKPIKEHFRNDFKQPFAVFDHEEIKNNIIIDPVPGNGYLFSAFQPHRSYNVGDAENIRISIDFRFTVLN